MGVDVSVVAVAVPVGVVSGLLVVAIFLIGRWLCRNRAASDDVSDSGGSRLPIRAADVIADSSSASISDPGDSEATRSFWGRRGHHDRQIAAGAASVSGIPRYSYRDIQKATENFTTILGQGSFGMVYKATMPTGEVVAVKVLANNSTQGEREFQTEVGLLSRLHHRNLVNLVGYCIDRGQRILVYEFMSNGSLASILFGDRRRVLSWEERLQIAYDVSHGIEYLHEGAVPPVIHRDLKSANILLDRHMRAKVSDFGLSKEDVYDGKKSGLKGTYGYMDPDYVTTNKFTKKSDVYSFGIVLFELITAINPQQGLMEYIDMACIGGEGKPEWEEIVDKELLGESSNVEDVRLLADIAHKCLHKIPRKRPPIADVAQAISRLRKRRISRDHGESGRRSETWAVLRRIELQQTELDDMAGNKDRVNSTLRQL